MSQWISRLIEKNKKALKGTDKWYPDQPEWGTPESTKKAKKQTPGQEDMDVKEEMTTTASAGIPQDTKNMGPRKKDKKSVVLKRFKKFIEGESNG